MNPFDNGAVLIHSTPIPRPVKRFPKEQTNKHSRERGHRLTNKTSSTPAFLQKPLNHRHHLFFISILVDLPGGQPEPPQASSSSFDAFPASPRWSFESHFRHDSRFFISCDVNLVKTRLPLPRLGVWRPSRVFVLFATTREYVSRGLPSDVLD